MRYVIDIGETNEILGSISTKMISESDGEFSGELQSVQKRFKQVHTAMLKVLDKTANALRSELNRSVGNRSIVVMQTFSINQRQNGLIEFECSGTGIEDKKDVALDFLQRNFIDRTWNVEVKKSFIILSIEIDITK